MTIDFDSLRTELTRPCLYGPSPVQSEADLFLGRAGRILPTVEASFADFERLRAVTEVASWAIASTARFVLPTQAQLEKVAFNYETGCWDSLVPKNKTRPHQPYGQLRVRGVVNPSGLAHRTMYLVLFGLDSLPNGRLDLLDHICERKSCCYPRHLEKVTHRENSRRGSVKLHRRPESSHPTLDI